MLSLSNLNTVLAVIAAVLVAYLASQRIAESRSLAARTAAGESRGSRPRE